MAAKGVDGALVLNVAVLCNIAVSELVDEMLLLGSQRAFSDLT